MTSLSQTKLFAKVCLTFLAVALSSHAAFSQTAGAAPPVKADDVHQLWSTIVDPLLRATVTSGPQGQNFGATMMVPLHAAFALKDERWIQSFADHFSRLAANHSGLPEEDLGRLQYLYLASQFIVLAKAWGKQDLIPPGLPDLLFADVHNVWYKKPAWQFDRQPFPGGARERMLWRLDHRTVQKSYLRAVNDVDFYVFVIAADLKAYGGTPAQKDQWNSTLDDVISVAHRTFVQEVVTQPGGGWLFQPGVWTDYPEYAYAGNKDIHPGMKAMPVRNIGTDSSHSLRFPIWLTSLMRAYPASSEEYRFYRELRGGLDNQFFNKVLVRPTSDYPCYRQNNFMDGSNGVYRWNYSSLGPNRGYGPYQNSAALVFGWWTFLDTDRIRGVYRDMAAEFPWPKQCIEDYLGPAPAAGYAATAFDPASPSMRVWHLLVMLASQI
jgi:hypothetical protein